VTQRFLLKKYPLPSVSFSVIDPLSVCGYPRFRGIALPAKKTAPKIVYSLMYAGSGVNANDFTSNIYSRGKTPYTFDKPTVCFEGTFDGVPNYPNWVNIFSLLPFSFIERSEPARNIWPTNITTLPPGGSYVARKRQGRGSGWFRATGHYAGVDAFDVLVASQ